jgi:raffinose/stachyose/melibiose transport system substrate-binding protein
VTSDKRIRLLLSMGASLALAFGTAPPTWAQDTVTLQFLTSNTPNDLKAGEALIAAFEAKNPNIKVNLETRPGGAPGDNIVKTRLATGDMDDVFEYNSGSLFRAIDPARNLVDLSDQPWQSDLDDSFKSVVSLDGKYYGAPVGGAGAGGILYNKKVFADLGLKPPKTWAEFMSNNAKIKAAGKIAPVIQTFKTTWTSQLFVLGDFYNVLQADPKFPEKYTANKAHYADTPAALKGFQHQADVLKAGDLNKNYASASYDDGVTMLVNGKGAQYPQLTFTLAAIQSNYPKDVANIGFFGMPGDDAAKHGATIWEPAGIYIPKTTKHLAEAKKFLAFVASPEGCDAQTKAVGITGPYAVKDCPLPSDVPPMVSDLAAYFKSGNTAPALEFLSPVKGPSLEQITVEVGSGIASPEQGAQLYDQDVKKEALQLGLSGW